ncbi:MAG: DUF1844 domain-containing protein [candidate division Zixibacteria bacterium]|nr:DUF1844 domain-containing protein [candidate division Zixibacteria bacterium]
MTHDSSQADMQFIQLTLSLQAGAMVQMGKIASPVTGKIERDLTQARATIDLLEMLHRKTKGNLSGDEQTLLDRILYELRLNYVDEAAKGGEDTPAGGVNPNPPSADTPNT